MLFEIILISITMIALLIASYSDLKIREVPDLLSYGLIFAALGIRLIFSFEFGWNIIISGLLGFAACFAIAYLFYSLHQWGGGDSKLLMGMGAVIGISIPFSASSFILLWYFLALLFLGAFYGILWMVILAMKNRTVFYKKYKEMIVEHKVVHLSLAILAILFLVLTFFFWFAWPLIILPLVLFYFVLFITVVEQNFFVKKLSAHDLTEGDWLAEEVLVDGKPIDLKRTLEKKHITTLQHLEKKKKIKFVYIKEGIPFIPSFLFAYLFIVFGEKLIYLLLQALF